MIGKTDPAGRLWFGTMDNSRKNFKRQDHYIV